MRGSSQLEGNVVALGKRYSDNIYISFEQAISTTTEYLVKLDYALTQRFAARPDRHHERRRRLLPVLLGLNAPYLGPISRAASLP